MGKRKNYIEEACERGEYKERTFCMLTSVDCEFDNYDEAELKKIVFNDFAHKILTLFKENPHAFLKHTPHTQMYAMVDDRWHFKIGVRNAKHIMHIADLDEGVLEFVQEYIEDYMQHNYIGRDVEVPTVEDIDNFCGGGEFPFIEVYLIKPNSQRTYLAYKLGR